MSSLTVPGPSTPQDWAELYRWPSGSTLRANMVGSLDGRSTVDGTSGGLGSPDDQQLLKILRATADVVLVGAGTVRAEGYDAFGTATQLRRLLRPQRTDPIRLAVVSGSGLPDGLPALSTAAVRPLVLTTELGAGRTPNGIAEVVVVGSDRIEPVRVRAELESRGLPRILCEGGPQLLGSLLQAAVVDELCLTHAPILVGSSGRELIGDTGSSRWTLQHSVRSDDHLFTLHRIVR